MVLRVFVFLFVIWLEWYFYHSIYNITKEYSELTRNVIKYCYFLLVAIVFSGLIAAMFLPPPMWSKFWQHTLGAAMFLILVCQVIGILPLVIDDIIRGFRWVVAKISSGPEIKPEGVKISRLKFFSYLATSVAGLMGASLLYGLIKGGHKYKIHRVKLKFPNLPAAFDGLKIVQISDIHTGSFSDTTHLSHAFDLVMEQKPDVIFFTGDLVNNLVEETNGFVEVYKKLKAPHGVYSVFGNHDYADYVQWPDKDEAHFQKEKQVGKPLLSPLQQVNVDRLKEVHASSGWKLLWNENTHLEKGDEKIAILGIQNCPYRGGFVRHRYGDMIPTYKGTEGTPFKILLSHDPSHWEGQITADEKYKDIDLTLSGHTHGMQFGIEIPGIKWSPVKYIYKQWAGLYQQGNQYLYVNRGLGYLGFNGRVGIWPEITVIELFRRSGKTFGTDQIAADDKPRMTNSTDYTVAPEVSSIPDPRDSKPSNEKI